MIAALSIVREPMAFTNLGDGRRARFEFKARIAHFRADAVETAFCAGWWRARMGGGVASARSRVRGSSLKLVRR
jgi:hypothetical protein